MVAQFFSQLSQNFTELLKDEEYYDTTIEVGEGSDVKIFRSHIIILCYRSPYLRRALASISLDHEENPIIFSCPLILNHVIGSSGFIIVLYSISDARCKVNLLDAI